MSKVSSSVFSGALWMMLLRFSIKGLGFVNTIILARLLLPADFGLVAIVMAIYAFIDLIKQFGFDVVLIQKQDACREDYDTAWTIKLIFGVLAAVILVAGAGSLAEYYQDPRLEELAYVVSLLFILNGSTNIGVVNFLKELNFKREFQFRIITKISSVCLTIVIAVIYRNYWALVTGMLFSAAVENIMSYLWSDFRPKFTLSRWKVLYAFSGWLMLNNLLKYLYNQFSGLIIGKVLGATSAGVYRVTTEFSNLPSAELIASVNKAAYPGYAKVSKDIPAMRALYLNVLASISLIGIPSSIAIALIAPFFIPVVLGSDWIDGIPVMEILGLSQAFICINNNANFVFLALGKPKLATLILTIRVTLVLSLMVLLSDLYGLIGFAYAYLITSLITFPLSFLIIRTLLDVKLVEYLAAIYRPAIACACCYVLAKWGLFLFFQQKIVEQYGLLDLVIAALLIFFIFLLCYSVVWLFSANKKQTYEYKIVTTLLEKLGF